MSRLWRKLAGLWSNRTLMGVDKAGNRYFARTEEIDGIVKEKRWVAFKGEQDPTSVPVEWICWLNGQRRRAPTPEEMMELEARREQVKMNVAILKEEEERKAKVQRTDEGKPTTIRKGADPDLRSFLRQFPNDSKGTKTPDSSQLKKPESSSEPTGSGESFRPGTWQPPT